MTANPRTIARPVPIGRAAKAPSTLLTGVLLLAAAAVVVAVAMPATASAHDDHTCRVGDHPPGGSGLECAVSEAARGSWRSLTWYWNGEPRGYALVSLRGDGVLVTVCDQHPRGGFPRLQLKVKQRNGDTEFPTYADGGDEGCEQDRHPYTVKSMKLSYKGHTTGWYGAPPF